MIDKKKAQERLQSLVSQGEGQGMMLLKHLQDNVPTDYRVPHSKIGFE